MFVEGNPAPTFKFFKGTQEIIEGGRYKLISDGDNNNMIMMAIAKVKAADESEYRVEIENCHGSDEANFMLFVSGYFHVFLSSYFFLFSLSLSLLKKFLFDNVWLLTLPETNFFPLFCFMLLAIWTFQLLILLHYQVSIQKDCRHLTSFV